MNRSPSEAAPECLLLAEGSWGSCLHAMRSLGRSGVRVFVAVAGSGEHVYRKSRYCSAAADFDATNSGRFCSEVQDWTQLIAPGNAPIVVVPLSDRLVQIVHESRGMFSGRFKLLIPPADATEALLDKARSFQVAQQSGLEVPPWVSVSSADDISDATKLKLPVVVRPLSWATTGDGYFKIVVYSSGSALHEGLRELLTRGARVVVQEFIDTPARNVVFAILWRSIDGSVAAVCTGRKRRQSAPEGGVMAWGEAVILPDVVDGAARFLEASGFTGLGGIEFIRAAGHLWFVEFNPRLEATHFLATRAGVDTVSMAYQDLACDEKPETLPRQRRATAWVGSAWLTRIVQQPSDWRILLRDRLAFAMSPGRVFAVASWEDPLPGLVLARRLVARGAVTVLRSLSERLKRRTRKAPP